MSKYVGQAKNEPVELILGNLLIGMGGFLVGWLLPNPSAGLYWLSGLVFFAFGIVLDVRVLLRFSSAMSEARQELKQARADLEIQKDTLTHATDELTDAIKQSEKMKAELKDARVQINVARSELQSQEKTLTEAAQDLKNVIKVQEDSKAELDSSRRQIRDANSDLQAQQRLLQDATRTLREVINKVEDTKRGLQEAERKTFSFISSASRSKPVEKMIEDVYVELDKSLKEIERVIGIHGYRRKPFYYHLAST